MAGYDPFSKGPFAAASRSFELRDDRRGRQFPCHVWYPAGEDESTLPLVLYSHPAMFHRKAATFLCEHLCSHGYVVAAMDHSEVVAPELGRQPEGETEEQKTARWNEVMASRVPDVLLLLDRMLAGGRQPAIGIVGHSFGGSTALSSAEDPRIRAVVALAPGGASKVRPGVLPIRLALAWGRDVPVLFLVAENDAALPLEGMYEIFDRTPATKQMVVLRQADHGHFMDGVEELHEKFRTMPGPPEIAAMQKDMLPIGELCSGEQGRLFTRGLTLAHFDAVLRGSEDARKFLRGDLQRELAGRGVDAWVHATPSAFAS